MRRSNQSGFTLVEILVVIAILTIVIGSIYGTFRAGSQSAADVEEDADLHQTARVLLGRMNSELASLYTLASEQTSEQGVCLQGESASDLGLAVGFGSLTFTTLSHQPCGTIPAQGDVCTVTYSVQSAQGDTPQGLYVAEDYLLGLSESSQGTQTTAPTTLLSDLVVGMECSYLNPTTEEWMDDWVNQTTLPAAVRVTLILQAHRHGALPITADTTVTLPTWGSTKNLPKPTAPTSTSGGATRTTTGGTTGRTTGTTTGATTGGRTTSGENGNGG